eukprot:364867_1
MDAEGGDIIIMNISYKHLDNNIFNLLIDDENKLQTLKTSSQTFNSILKINKDKDDEKQMYLLDANANRNSHNKATTNKDRFIMLSEQIYKTITQGAKMAELQLNSNEIIHLIGAIFNCSYLYGGIKDEQIHSWLRNQMVIPANSRMHFLIKQLLNNSSPDLTLKYDINRPPSLMQMLQIRLAWHLVGVISSINQSNPFYVLLTDPLHYKDAFLIGMPESQQMALLKAMKGHSVFICPNKHLYFVANCGATKESGKCYQCNAAVGNKKNKKQHIAADGNKKLGKIGNNGEIIPDEYGATNGIGAIPTQYMATGYIDTNGNDDCTRGLSEIAVMIIRCFVLCVLWLHHSERSSDEFPSYCQQFMYPHQFTKHKNKNNNNNNNNKQITKKTRNDQKDRFNRLSEQMYKAINYKEKMAEELQLNSNEIVHLV